MTDAVRRATTDDAWAIHETARESWHAAYADLLAADTVETVLEEWYALADLESAIDAARAREDVAFLVADPDDGPADLGGCRGFVHAVPWPEDAAVAYLARLHVAPGARGNGLGTALLEALERVQEDSFERVRVAVLADNEIGLSFAESAGFERVAIRETGLAEGLEEYVLEKPI